MSMPIYYYMLIPIAHILCSYSHCIHIRVFEELALEGRLSYKKRLAEFVEKYPDECISQPKKKAKRSASKKKEKKISKKYDPEMVESSTKVTSSPTSVTAKKIFDGRYTPRPNTAQTAAARYVTPNTIKHHILPPPIPDTSLSLPHFDSLDVDLNAESEHSLDSDSWTDFADSFFGTEEEGSMSSRSDDHSMHCVSMDDLSLLPSSSTIENSKPRNPNAAPDDHGDFLHLIAMIDDNL